MVLEGVINAPLSCSLGRARQLPSCLKASGSAGVIPRHSTYAPSSRTPSHLLLVRPSRVGRRGHAWVAAHAAGESSIGSSSSTTTDASEPPPPTNSSPAPRYSSYAQHYYEQHSNLHGSSVLSNSGAASSSHNSSSTEGGSSSHAGSVQDALAEAERALDSAEKWVAQVGDGHAAEDRRLHLELPEDNRSSSLWMRAFRLARSITLLSAVSVAMVASHAFGLYIQLAGAAVGAVALALYGYKTSSLNLSGACAAVVVGAASLGCSLRFGVTIVSFFLSSSKLTQFKEELKEGLDDQAKKGGQRDWMQVACNAGLPTLLAVIYGILAGCVDLPLGPSPSLEPWRAKLLTALMGGFLGYYACCCGDTWASELGTLSKETTRLITDLRPVRRGTNGGVTLLGLGASAMGGLFVGLMFYLSGLIAPTLWIFSLQHTVALHQWQIIPLGMFAGLGGSLIDSLLGATVQFTGYHRKLGKLTSYPGDDVVHISGSPLLTNNLVNLLSASVVAALTALAALYMFA